MQTFQMTCSCGHEIKVQAADRDDAVRRIQATMGKDAIAAHIKDRHPGEPVPTVEQVHAMIAQATVPAGSAAGASPAASAEAQFCTTTLVPTCTIS